MPDEPMLGIRLSVQGDTIMASLKELKEMAEKGTLDQATLDQFGFRKRGDNRTGVTYNWDLWLDGKVHVLLRGKDYTCKEYTVRAMAMAKAKKKGLGVAFNSSVKEGVCALQAFPLGEGNGHTEDEAVVTEEMESDVTEDASEADDLTIHSEEELRALNKGQLRELLDDGGIQYGEKDNKEALITLCLEHGV